MRAFGAIVSHFPATLLVAAAMLFHVHVALAATCEVPSASYGTIQTAVNDAACTTIEVAPGTYTENVSIARSLFLQGEQAGVDARTRAGDSGESIIVGNAAVTINAPNVFVDGFTIRGPSGNASGTGVVVKGSGVVIRNNILDDITGVSSTAQAIAIYRGRMACRSFTT